MTSRLGTGKSITFFLQCTVNFFCSHKVGSSLIYNVLLYFVAQPAIQAAALDLGEGDDYPTQLGRSHPGVQGRHESQPPEVLLLQAGSAEGENVPL